MQPITYYVNETDQINSFMNLVGEHFEKLHYKQLWALGCVLTRELAFEGVSRLPQSFDNLCYTRVCIVKLNEDELLDAALKVLDGISRKEAKQLLLALTSIAAESADR